MEAKKPRRLGYVSAAGGLGFDAAAITTMRAANRAEAVREWERWAICKKCGSQDIRTVKAFGFTPTDMLADHAPVGSPELSAASYPAASAPLPGRNPDGTWQVGARVVLRQLGYRGLQGVILRRGPMGNYTVSLDRGGKASSIPGDKMEPA
jgi:hypothetical protein